MVDVHGLAEKNQEVKIYVDNKLSETLTSNAYTGKFKGSITLPQCKNGTVNSIYAQCGDVKSEMVEVTYSTEKPIIEDVTLSYYFYSDVTEPRQIDITDSLRLGVSPLVSYYPNRPLTFEITSLNSDKIDRMFVTSTKGKDVKYLEAFYNEETNTWITEGKFDGSNYYYVPGSLNISIIEKGTEISDNLTEVFEDNKVYHNPGFIKFIIDPSGIVYEAVMGNPVEGAETTIYYLDPETKEAVKWNAEDYDQINPLISNEAGGYAWDVPEGLWKVVCKKEGYETVETDWMDVPPVRTDVHIALVNKDAPKITSAKLGQNSIEVKFSKFVDTYTVKDTSVKVDGFDGKYSITPKLLSANDRYADTFIISGDFGKETKSISITDSIESYAGTAAKAETVSLDVLPDFYKPDIKNVNLVYQKSGRSKTKDITNILTKGLSNNVNCAPAEIEHFEITASNSDKIGRMFVTTRAMNVTRFFEAFYNKETGTWITKDDLSSLTVTGILNISLVNEETGSLTSKLLNIVENNTVFENTGSLKFAYGNDAVQAVVSGDVNGDGEVNAADLVMLIKNMLGAGTVTSIQNADLNKDKTVNIIDLCMLKASLLEQ